MEFVVMLFIFMWVALIPLAGWWWYRRGNRRFGRLHISQQYREMIARMPRYNFTVVADQTGYFTWPPPEWLVEIADAALEEGEDVAQLAERIRTVGEPLTAEQKQALGVDSAVELGRDYVASLSPAGRKRPVEAITIAYQRAVGRKTRVKMLEQAGQANREEPIGIAVPQDDKTCEAVRHFDGKRLPLSELPILPVSGCNADWCRCQYVL